MISGIVSLIVGVVGTVVGILAAVLGLAVSVVTMVLVGLVFPLIAICAPLLAVMAVVWLLGLPSKRCARRRQPEDIRVMQNIHRGLARMDNRLNSLETIMVDDRPRTYVSR